MPAPTATWNPARDVWEETGLMSLFSEHLDVWRETWPRSGMTRSGSAFVLPTSAPRTVGSGCSSPPTLPTLMPTPRVGGMVNGPSQREIDAGNPKTRLEVAVALLPTPAVNDMGEGKTLEWWDEWTDRMRSEHGNGNGHGKSLAIEAMRLLPTPMAGDAKDSRNSTARRSKEPPTGVHAGDTLLDAMTHIGAARGPRERGASTPQPSTDGKPSSDDQPPTPLTTKGDCRPGSSSS